MDLKKIIICFFLVVSPWSVVHGPWSFAHAQPLPPILKILEQEPQNLTDIEQLIRYHWHEKALSVLENYPDEAETEKILYLKGLALLGLKRFDDALQVFETILSRDGSRHYRWLAQMKKAQALSRLKRYSESIDRYAWLIQHEKRWRNKTNLKWAGFKTALEGKEYAAGLKFLSGLQDARAHWYRGWCHFRLNRWDQALSHWQNIPKRRSQGFYLKALFWRAQILEKQGNTKAAQGILVSLSEKFQHTYYGLLAKTHFNSPSPLPPSPFGLRRTGVGEGGGEGKIDYEPLIKKEAKRRKLDPLLVMALIRQESNFNPHAVSPSGAMGLMQMIPQTALRLVKASKRKSFAWPQMFDPQTNISLGVFYLRFLNELFARELPLVIAAYNAGEEAVSRWRSLRETETMLYFIEEIPYDQTQNYVQKVLTNYWIYSWLYGSGEKVIPAPRVSFPRNLSPTLIGERESTGQAPAGI